MAPPSATIGALLFALILILAHVHSSTCQQLVKGSVSCLDCATHYDLSGVRVAVKCSKERRLIYALTNKQGYFQANIPTNSSASTNAPAPDCLALLLGGPVQLCSSKKSMVSRVVKAPGLDSYSISTPLTFFSSCQSKVGKQKIDEKAAEFGSMKPVDFPPMNFPPPANWTLPPLIYMFPFIPIIGIP